MEIPAASITAFYLYDVAEQIDLPVVQSTLRAGAAARLQQKTAAPTYLQYQTPPLVIDGDLAGMPAVDGFQARLKFFDYGVVSLALTRPFQGSWSDLIAVSQTYIENEALEAQAEASVRAIVGRAAAAMVKVRDRYVAEDYLTIAVSALDPPVTADQLLAQRPEELTRILRGERQALSPQEQDEVLRNRLSYFATDLVIPTWNAAFIYDTEAGSAARLGLGGWKQSVEDKLETLDDIYRFAVEQVAISRGQFMELAIILILVLELVLFFLGIMK